MCGCRRAGGYPAITVGVEAARGLFLGWACDLRVCALREKPPPVSRSPWVIMSFPGGSIGPAGAWLVDAKGPPHAVGVLARHPALWPEPAGTYLTA